MGIKLGLRTGDPTQAANAIDGIIGRMANEGVKTAGKFTASAQPQAQKPFISKAANMPTVSSPVQKSFSDKIVGGGKAVGGFVADIAKSSGKNVWGLVSTPFQVTKDVAYIATHGGNDRYQEATKNLKAKTDEVNSTYTRLNNDLMAGRLSQSEYDRQLGELNSWSGSTLDELRSKQSQAKLETYGYRDWQTGQYKDNVSPGDIFNIFDGGLTIASFGTAGAAKGMVMKTAEEGLFKNGGTFMLKSLAKVAGNDFAVGVGVKASSGKAAVVLSKVDDIVAKTIQKVPGLREYSERQIAKLGGDASAKQFVKSAIAETIIHAPLRRSNMESAQTIVDSIMTRDFLSTEEGESWLSSGASQSVLAAMMLLEGGPIGASLKYLSKVGNKARIMAFGDNAVSAFTKLDDEVLVKYAGNPELLNILQSQAEKGVSGTNVDHFMRLISGDADDAVLGYKWLADHPEKADAFRSFAASVLNKKYASNVYQVAAAGIIKDLLAQGKAVNVDDSMAHLFNWQGSGELVEELTKRAVAQGILKPGQRLSATRWTRELQNQVRKNITSVMRDVSKQIDDAKAAGQVIEKGTKLATQKQAVLEYIQGEVSRGAVWAQHDGLVEDIVNRVTSAQRAFSGKKKLGKSIVGAITDVDTAKAAPKIKGASKIMKELADAGYVVSKPELITHPFVSIADAKGYQIESILVGEVKNGLAQTLGLTKKASVDDLSAVLGDDVARVYGANKAYGRVGALLSKLGIGFDDAHKDAYRLIRTSAANHIDDAKIGTGGVEALKKLNDYAENSKTITDLRQMTKNEISKALNISKESAGKVQQSLIQAHLDVPAHIRGLGDSAVDLASKYNPLQQTYQRIQGTLRYTYNPFFRVQEVAETKLLSWATGFKRLGGTSRQDLDTIVDKMDNLRLLESTQYGEAAGNVALGRITANITKFQKRDIAAVVDGMAQKMTNGNVDELLSRHTDDVLAVIRPIVQYPTSGALNSNFARTLNLVAFPARYNIKVTSLALQTLARQTPTVQATVMRGLWDFDSWLKTDDGMAWRQDYAAEIAAFKWLTPVGSISWAMDRLQGENGSWRDIGMVGGLPFGVFTQILTNQGVLPEQAPYVDPKTGDIYSRRIPESIRGRVSMAIMDMLGSTFTYPGKTLALPSKSGFVRGAAEKLTGSTGRDFRYEKYTPEDLSPNKRREQQFWAERSGNVEEQPVTPDGPAPLPIYSQPGTAPISSERYSKSDIREASKAGSRAKKAAKTKQPVPFTQIFPGAK